MRRFIVCNILASFVLVLNVWAETGTGISTSSYGETANSDGSSSISETTSWQDADGSSSTSTTSHTSHPDGSATESQTATRTAPNGESITETTEWARDPNTGEWTETGHKTTEAPPTNDGFQADQEANGEPVQTDYGPDGVHDHRSQSDSYIDLQKGDSWTVDHATKSVHEVPAVPSRQIPLTCQVSTLYLDFGPKIDIPKLDPNNPKALKEFAKKLPELQRQIKLMTGKAKDQKDIKDVKMRMLLVPHKRKIRIAGQPATEYRIFSDERMVAKIWMADHINMAQVLKHKKVKKKKLDQLLMPYWAKNSQRGIFQRMILKFEDVGGRTNNFIVKSISKKKYQPFPKQKIPPGYTHTKRTMREIRKDAEESMKYYKANF
jgi:hypothetical protein